MKRTILKNIAKIGKYTAEQGDGWPTFWGFHEIMPDSSAKEQLKNLRDDKKISKNYN